MQRVQHVQHVQPKIDHPSINRKIGQPRESKASALTARLCQPADATDVAGVTSLLRAKTLTEKKKVGRQTGICAGSRAPGTSRPRARAQRLVASEERRTLRPDVT